MKQIIIFVFLLCSIVWADNTPLKVDNEYKSDLYYSSDIVLPNPKTDEEEVWKNQIEDLIGEYPYINQVIDKKKVSYHVATQFYSFPSSRDRETTLSISEGFHAKIYHFQLSTHKIQSF